jgi:hypothetical protein
VVKFTLWGEDMTVECGICEFKGHLKDAPLFVCFNCGDAIRRLVWIHEQKLDRMPSVAPQLKIENATTGMAKPALLGKG